jgi:EAL domain-containing protein (putative c-di-GMP-specific phosphodiesterase class I)
MDVVWVSEFLGAYQVLRFVHAAPGLDAPPVGTRLPLDGSYCARVLDGRFPAVIQDARSVPEAVLLELTSDFHIGSYVGVPLLGQDDVAVGMLCAVSHAPAPGLDERDVASLRLMAELLHDLQRRALSSVDARRAEERLRAVMTSVIAGDGRQAVLQPVVDTRSGLPVFAEGLTRFPRRSPAAGGDDAGSVRAPAQWFDDAGRLGLRQQLELAAATSVLDLLEGDHVPDGVALAVNLAPDTVVATDLDAVLADRDLPRVVIEITEHAPVTDYGRLETALRPYRAAGLRVAVDDTGAGYASLRHVLALRPDLLKIDMALTRDADVDPARRTLLGALATFGTEVGCELVAEGVETQAQLSALTDIGIPLAQGFLIGPPSLTPRWSGYAVG